MLMKLGVEWLSVHNRRNLAGSAKDHKGIYTSYKQKMPNIKLLKAKFYDKRKDTELAKYLRTLK